MKRLLITITVLVVGFYGILLITSCDNIKKDYNDTNADTSTLPVKDNAKIVEVSPWTISTFVDDFGDIVEGSKYIFTTTKGYYSNSAVSGRTLCVRIIVDDADVGIFLSEECTRPDKKFIGCGTIKLKNSKGQTLSIISCSEWDHSGGLRIYDFYLKGKPINTDYTKFKNFIMKSKNDIKVVINDDYSSTYQFSFSSNEFNKQLAAIQ